MDFTNSYEDETRAASYATLEFSGTYHLAFRDLPALIEKYTTGKKALDFGCGTGRSTRFLQRLGLQVTGIDISNEMIKLARRSDSQGTYLHIADGDFHQLTTGSFDFILSAFTFDNILMEQKPRLFEGLTALLAPQGILVNLVSSPAIYTHEWTSFTTKDFPENANAKTGDIVKIVTINGTDTRPCLDILCTDSDYRRLYHEACLQVLETRQPLASGNEPYSWKNETRIAPWTLYVLTKH
jgi:ubiquinone/menaquinone biosynthesis C-methylase UbiE